MRQAFPSRSTFSTTPLFALPPLNLFDTTLRDGLDGLNISITTANRVNLALALSTLNFNVLEVGYTRLPASLAAIPSISSALKQHEKQTGKEAPDLCVLTPTVNGSKYYDDIARAVENGLTRVNIFSPATSLDNAAGKRISETVRYVVKAGVPQVQFTVQNATDERIQSKHLVDMVSTAMAEGVDVISLADSAGHATPGLVREMFEMIANELGLDQEKK